MFPYRFNSALATFDIFCVIAFPLFFLADTVHLAAILFADMPARTSVGWGTILYVCATMINVLMSRNHPLYYAAILMVLALIVWPMLPVASMIASLIMLYLLHTGTVLKTGHSVFVRVKKED